MPRQAFTVLRNGRFIRSRVPARFAGWKKGKIFGRLTCRSGMRMKPENRVYFLTWDDAVAAGYRPCKHCKPEPGDRYRHRDGEWRLVEKKPS